MRPDHIHMLVAIPPTLSVSGFMGYLKGESSLMMFRKWGNMKFTYRNREFRCKGYFVDTVGRNTNSYTALQSLRYCDVLGRADLFTFMLFNKETWTHEQAQQLPKAVITPTGDKGDKIGGVNAVAYLPKGKAIALDKDNREALSFNYQINLLHRPTEADTEDFITFPNLFGEKESPLKMCFLSEPQSLFTANANMTTDNVVADDVPYSTIENVEKNAIEVRLPTEDSLISKGVNLSEVKSIVLYQVNEYGEKNAYIAKNVCHRKSGKDKMVSWWIYPKFSG